MSAPRPAGLLGRRHGPDPVHAVELFSYAVDFNGDGRRDIWTNVPDAGIDRQLYAEGRLARQPDWGFEVVVPKNFD